MRHISMKNIQTVAKTLIIASTFLTLVKKYPYNAAKKSSPNNSLYNEIVAKPNVITGNQSKTALVVGLGIAGMSAAIGLKKAGYQPILIEKSDTRRTGGYFIGLSAEAFEAAKYLGIDDVLLTRTPVNGKTWEINKDNQAHLGLNFTDQPNHPEVVLRGDVEEALWVGIEREQIPVIFSTTVTHITNNTDSATSTVTLTNTKTGDISSQTFDLVVGGDGVRSSIRRQVFGSDDKFMHSVGAIICAYTMQAQMPGYEEHSGLVAAEEERAIWFFPFSNRPPTALLVYRTDNVDAQFKIPPRQALENAFAGMSGKGTVAFALDQFDKAENYLFDSVNTVTMPKWSKDNVVLLGDAAWCLTLFSGYGATSAIHGGAILGKILSQNSDIPSALIQWETALRPFIQKQRQLVPLKTQLFVPSNKLTYAIRTLIISSGFLPKLHKVSEKRTEIRAKVLNSLFGERVDTKA